MKNNNPITTDSDKPVNLTKRETTILKWCCSVDTAVEYVVHRIIFTALMIILAYGGAKFKKVNAEQDARIASLEAQITNFVSQVNAE